MHAPTAKSWEILARTSSSDGGNESMIRANITPMIGRGAPAATARTTAQNRMARDWVSWRGLKRAIYDVLTFLTVASLRKRRRDINKDCAVLGLPSATPSEIVIGSAV
jgi:hypothetical protein